MKLWQKFSAIFFIGAMTIFLPSVNAYTEMGSGETPPSENIKPPTSGNNKLPPINDGAKDKNPGDKKNPGNNENSDGNKNPDKNKNPTEPPKNIQTIPSENLPEEEPDFEDTVDSGVLGDINNDGELNAVDLVVLQKYLKGDAFEINETAADINGDGTISKFDVFALLNLIKAEKKGTGDVNNDGKVDIYDVHALTEYLANPSTKINISNADLTGDGRIGTDDLKILKAVISELQR